MEIDFQDIFSGFQFRLYVCFPFTEHVVGLQYFLFVQIYVCISVESFEYEVYILPLHYFGSQLEGGLVDPVFLIYPLHTAFVEAEEGIFDDLCTTPGTVAGYQLLSRACLNCQPSFNSFRRGTAISRALHKSDEVSSDARFMFKFGFFMTVSY